MKNLPLFLVAAAIGYFYQESIARPSVKDPQSDEQVIRISAKTFEFEPSEITVKKGIPVTFELVSADRHHGFKLSAFNCGRTSDPVLLCTPVCQSGRTLVLRTRKSLPSGFVFLLRTCDKN